MDRQKKSINVVAAVIRKDSRVFATQRGYGNYKGWWEFPGGKIEGDEKPEEALIREIREELATEITVDQYLTTVEYDYPEFHLHMDCFWCSIKEGQLDLLEHQAARWLDLADLRRVNWLPADILVVNKIEENISDIDGQSQPDTEVHRLFCSFCGYQVPADSYFCPKCGHYLHKSGHVPETIPGGREKCEQLREIRKKIAEANGIEYEPVECFHEGPCAGTCPVCDEEIRYLDEQLEQKRARGEEIRLTALVEEAVGPFTGGDGRDVFPPDPVLAGIPMAPPFHWEETKEKKPGFFKRLTQRLRGFGKTDAGDPGSK